MIKKAVILCGGLATRFLPITKTLPKEMLPILNRPAIDYCIEDLKQNGITDVLIILGRNKEIIENYYDRNIELEERLKDSNKQDMLKSVTNMINGINITFIRQLYAKGTGYAVNLAKTWIGKESFILMFPDDLIVGKSYTKQLIEEFEKTKQSILPLKEIDISECTKYGMVAFKNENSTLKINNIIEKPSIENTPSNICYTGGGIFTSEIFDHLSSCKTHSNGEIYLTDAFTPLIQLGKMYGKIIAGERIDFGNPLGFVKGNIIAALNDENYKDNIKSFIKNLADNM